MNLACPKCDSSDVRRLSIMTRMVEAPDPWPLTLGETESLITDPLTGLYPHKDQYRNEVVRELRYTVLKWGAEKRWAEVETDDFTQLGRMRVNENIARGLDGYRTAEIVVARMLTIGTWLREKGKIPSNAARAPHQWKKKLKQYWRKAKDSRHEYQPTDHATRPSSWSRSSTTAGTSIPGSAS